MAASRLAKDVKASKSAFSQGNCSALASHLALQSRSSYIRGRSFSTAPQLSVTAVSYEGSVEWGLGLDAKPSAEQLERFSQEAQEFAEQFPAAEEHEDSLVSEDEVQMDESQVEAEPPSSAADSWDEGEAFSEFEELEDFEDGASQAEEAIPPATSRRKRRERKSGRPQATGIPLHCLPKLAIIGRPNVGKSALFNRLAKSNLAIVYDYPGVTRDRQYTRAVWGDKEFVVVDTGGLMSEATKLPASERMQAIRGISDQNLPQAIERQAAAGIVEADTLLLVVDGQAGLTSADEEIVEWLRKTHPQKPVTLAVNKCENIRTADVQAAEFWNMGIEPIAVSAISGTGTGDLMDKVVSTLPPPTSTEEEELETAPLSVAIIGRPNVGKSSLLNALVGSERAIVSSVSGTTRDAVDTEVVTPSGQRFTLIDTAGIRKRASVSESPDGAEPLSVQRAIQAVQRAQIAVLVLDAVDCTKDGRFVVTQQDFRLAELIAAEGRGCVVVVNKWDAIPVKDSSTLSEYQKELLAQLRQINWATVVFTSALSGQRVHKILDAVAAASEEHSRRISTATLNMVVQETVNWRAPPTSRAGKKGRVYYATQAAVRPPTFVFFVNDSEVFTEDYRRYVERQLRENVGFPGSPLRVFWRGKNPRVKSNARQ